MASFHLNTQTCTHAITKLFFWTIWEWLQLVWRFTTVYFSMFFLRTRAVFLHNHKLTLRKYNVDVILSSIQFPSFPIILFVVAFFFFFSTQGLKSKHWMRVLYLFNAQQSLSLTPQPQISYYSNIIECPGQCGMCMIVSSWLNPGEKHGQGTSEVVVISPWCHIAGASNNSSSSSGFW